MLRLLVATPAGGARILFLAPPLHAGADSTTAIPVTLDQVVTIDRTGETRTPATVHIDHGLTDRVGVGRDSPAGSYSTRVGDYVDVAGLDVQVLERSGGWAHVLCSNGWSAWVDSRALQELTR